MKPTLTLLAAVAALATSAAALAQTPAIDGASLTSPPVHGPPIAIRHVTVLAMTPDATPRGDMTVLLRDGRILSVTPSTASPVPKGFRIVEGAGKFLMPALADMHAHPGNDRMMRIMSGQRGLPAGAFDTSDEYLPYVANGVLQVLNMAAMPDAIGQRAEIEGGRALGPHLGLAAMVDGRPPLWPEGISHSAATPDEGRALVRRLKADGFDHIKTYSNLSLETFSAVVDEAAKQGMKALGHIPGRQSGQTERYFQPNYAMVAHAEEFALAGVAQTPGALCTRSGCTADEADIPRYVAMAKANGTWLTATLTLEDRILQQMQAQAPVDRPEFAYVNPLTRAAWPHMGDYAKAPADRIARQQRVAAFAYKLTKAFADAGVPVLAGTDTGVPGLVQGFALHDELEALSRAGLTSQQILEAATRQSAEWLGVLADRGTLEAGKRADLILLDADPLADVANTRRIAMVSASGRPFSRAELDRRMAALAARYAAMKVPAAPPAPGGGRWDPDEH